MGWLFAQLWFWLLVSFVLGSGMALAWVRTRLAPRHDRRDSEVR